MGVVYRATHVALERQGAVKLIAPDLATNEDFRRRFQRESKLAASIDHPHVIPVFDAGEEAGQLYVAMRFVEGTDLAELLAERGRLAPEEAVAVISQVADGLDAAHAKGLVHRDVKPANVLLESRARVSRLPHRLRPGQGRGRRLGRADADGPVARHPRLRRARADHGRRRRRPGGRLRARLHAVPRGGGQAALRAGDHRRQDVRPHNGPAAQPDQRTAGRAPRTRRRDRNRPGQGPRGAPGQRRGAGRRGGAGPGRGSAGSATGAAFTGPDGARSRTGPDGAGRRTGRDRGSRPGASGRRNRARADGAGAESPSPGDRRARGAAVPNPLPCADSGAGARRRVRSRARAAPRWRRRRGRGRRSHPGREPHREPVLRAKHGRLGRFSLGPRAGGGRRCPGTAITSFV